MGPFPRGWGGFGARTQVLEFPPCLLVLFSSYFSLSVLLYVLFEGKLLFQTCSLSFKVSLWMECLFQMLTSQTDLPMEQETGRVKFGINILTWGICSCWGEPSIIIYCLERDWKWLFWDFFGKEMFVHQVFSSLELRIMDIPVNPKVLGPPEAGISFKSNKFTVKNIPLGCSYSAF